MILWLSVLLAMAVTAPASAAFLGANPRLAESFLNTGIEQVAGDVSRETLPGSGGAWLRRASEFFVAPSRLPYIEGADRASQVFVKDLSHVTGKTAAARNRAIQAVIKENLPNLRLSYEPEYSPFIRTGVAQQGTGTQIGKNVFGSRAELIDTIIHEELHHRWWKRGVDSPHHASDYVPNERFYEVIQRYKQMRGWNE